MALGVACTVTVAIFFVWIIPTKARFEARLEGMAQKAATSTAAGARGSAVVEPASPFEAISQTFSEGLDTIEKQFEELSKIAK